MAILSKFSEEEKLKTLKTLIILLSLIHINAHAVAAKEHNAFFQALKNLCGKAFEGKLVVDFPKSEGFDGRLVMHVKKCQKDRIEIPFHVGENRSRTWIITQTGSGLSLKHDHRHSDGTPEKVSLYGGHTQDRGWDQVQSFPADDFTKQMFVDNEIPQSITNTWKLYLYPKKFFSYVLVREGREFRVDFDLSKAVKVD